MASAAASEEEVEEEDDATLDRFSKAERAAKCFAFCFDGAQPVPTIEAPFDDVTIVHVASKPSFCWRGVISWRTEHRTFESVISLSLPM